MFKTLITSTTALSLLTLAACSAETEAPKTTQASTPIATQTADTMTKTAMADTKVKAVLMYASWCGSCKVLDPKIKAAQASNAFKGVSFSRIDYTDKDKENFWAQAAALGVEAPVRTTLGNNPKTGLLLLIDADDNVLVSKVTKAMSGDEIAQAINEAVAAS